MLSVKLNGLRSLHPLVALDSPAKNSPAADSAKTPIPSRERSQLEQQLGDSQAERQLLLVRLKEMRQALESAEQRRLEVGARLDELQSGNAELRRTEKDRDYEIAQLREQLDGVNSQRDSYRAATIVLQNQLTGLRNKAEELTSEVGEAQQLNAAANQAKELIVARNLHIVDVHDNANGSKPRPFGRIFYTEGKKLVFYAYDLGDPSKLSAKVSFYVWGETTGTTQQVRNLGIFHADDAQDGRWVVTLDDPHVLAHINTVFVTAESNKKTVTKPHGNRILVAFLDGDPNHP
jgi:hypothetical protein